MQHPSNPVPRSGGPRPARRALLALSAALMLTMTLGGVVAQTVRLATHDSFALPEALVDAFQEETGIRIDLLSAGDAGEMVNRALLIRPRPLADAMFGIDDALIAREGAAELFAPYRSAHLDAVPDDLRFADDVVAPVTVGYVAFNLDLAGLHERGLSRPTDLTDLTSSELHGATVVPDPATSSPGLAFLLTTVARFGEGGSYDWLDYWADLRDADVRVVGGWSDAYYTWFSRYGGDRPIVLSYLTSPAAEVIFADQELDEAPTANLLCDRCVWRQIEAAGVLRGARDVEAAQAVVDFLLSPEVQAAVPEAMFVHPARSGVALPDAFTSYAPRPEPDQVATLTGDTIEAHQARWLEQWTQVVRQGRDPSEVR
ncbi:MAG: thiamine ABC transporter substrate-binding protein [Trueperaceae bacterium]